MQSNKSIPNVIKHLLGNIVIGKSYDQKRGFLVVVFPRISHSAIDPIQLITITWLKSVQLQQGVKLRDAKLEVRVRKLD